MPIHLPSGDVDLNDLADQARSLADALDRLAADGRPSRADMAGAPVIDMWRPARRFAPALIGLVDGHPILKSPKPKMTSELFALDSDGHWARTWSRWYRLGDALPSGNGRRN